MFQLTWLGQPVEVLTCLPIESPEPLRKKYHAFAQKRHINTQHQHKKNTLIVVRVTFLYTLRTMRKKPHPHAVFFLYFYYYFYFSSHYWTCEKITRHRHRTIEKSESTDTTPIEFYRLRIWNLQSGAVTESQCVYSSAPLGLISHRWDVHP